MNPAVLTVYFNACGWSALCRNLLRFLRQQEVEGGGVCGGEAYDGGGPDNVTVHWCRPETPHHGTTPAAPGQFAQYLAVPERLGLQFDACLIDGRARVDAALRVAPFLKPGAWLFFHDWSGRTRYTGRLPELLGHDEWCEEAAVRESPQTMAVFRRRFPPACEELSVPGTGAGPPCQKG